MSQPEGQRRFVRRPVEVTFRLRDSHDPGHGELLFDAVDISQGGAFLQSDLLLEVGEEMEVVFRLSSSKRTITAMARVAWATRKSDAK